jgi:ribosome-interacting GTPase 1
LDLPGIIEGAKDGKGRGRQVISTARTCGLILIVLDCLKPLTHKRIIEKELEGFGIRLNKEAPDITFKKKEKGGINFSSNVFLNFFLTLEDSPIFLDRRHSKGNFEGIQNFKC